MSDRIVCWFSCGAASAVASALMLAEHGSDVVLAYIDTGAEHEDNARFLHDAERWLDHEIVRLRSDRYADTWDVWRSTRFLNGPYGARCTTELKKKVRSSFERPTDVQVFGFTTDEVRRADRFREQNPGVDVRTPLIERGLGKNDCLSIIDRAEIEMPIMYKLGYLNNNCVPCVKGGMGYWNKIRQDFPEEFDRMARLERELSATALKNSDGSKLYLDTLDPDRGRYHAEENHECGLMCSVAEEDIETIVQAPRRKVRIVRDQPTA